MDTDCRKNDTVKPDLCFLRFWRRISDMMVGGFSNCQNKWLVFQNLLALPLWPNFLVLKKTQYSTKIWGPTFNDWNDEPPTATVQWLSYFSAKLPQWSMITCVFASNFNSSYHGPKQPNCIRWSTNPRWSSHVQKSWGPFFGIGNNEEMARNVLASKYPQLATLRTYTLW